MFSAAEDRHLAISTRLGTVLVFMLKSAAQMVRAIEHSTPGSTLN
jgi:hypothetical protein